MSWAASVRVAKLEDRVGNVKVTGDARISTSVKRVSMVMKLRR